MTENPEFTSIAIYLAIGIGGASIRNVGKHAVAAGFVGLLLTCAHGFVGESTCRFEGLNPYMATIVAVLFLAFYLSATAGRGRVQGAD